MSENCSYCGKPLRAKYKFSYGIPGIPQVFACDRKLCHAQRVVVRKVKDLLMPIIRKLSKWIQTGP